MLVRAERSASILLAVIDGPGHGPRAAAAFQVAVDVLTGVPFERSTELRAPLLLSARIPGGQVRKEGDATVLRAHVE